MVVKYDLPGQEHAFLWLQCCKRREEYSLDTVTATKALHSQSQNVGFASPIFLKPDGKFEGVEEKKLDVQTQPILIGERGMRWSKILLCQRPTQGHRLRAPVLAGAILCYIMHQYPHQRKELHKESLSPTCLVPIFVTFERG